MEAALTFTTFTHSLVIPVCRRPAYTIAYELCDGHTFVHVAFHQSANAAIMRAFGRDVAALFELHGGPVHCTTTCPHGDDWDKFDRFVRRAGFNFNCVLQRPEGGSSPVYTMTNLREARSGQYSRRRDNENLADHQ